jgi:hypothetical protein
MQANDGSSILICPDIILGDQLYFLVLLSDGALLNLEFGG